MMNPDMDLTRCSSGTRRVVVVTGIMLILFPSIDSSSCFSQYTSMVYNFSEYMTDKDCDDILAFTQTMDVEGLLLRCTEIAEGLANSLGIVY